MPWLYDIKLITDTFAWARQSPRSAGGGSGQRDAVAKDAEMKYRPIFSPQKRRVVTLA